MSNTTKEQMKEEAIARMTLLHIHSNAIHEFRTENLVNYCFTLSRRVYRQAERHEGRYVTKGERT